MREGLLGTLHTDAAKLTEGRVTRKSRFRDQVAPILKEGLHPEEIVDGAATSAVDEAIKLLAKQPPRDSLATLPAAAERSVPVARQRARRLVQCEGAEGGAVPAIHRARQHQRAVQHQGDLQRREQLREVFFQALVPPRVRVHDETCALSPTGASSALTSRALCPPGPGRGAGRPEALLEVVDEPEVAVAQEVQLGIDTVRVHQDRARGAVSNEQVRAPPEVVDPIGQDLRGQSSHANGARTRSHPLGGKSFDTKLPNDSPQQRSC
mmetsp:Transcript_118518/g.377767  ORF Transcript_118518/g.377767 Transcript_118518/m.377767 type:complete len:266 (-) Transcript_118518:707-1504(-)